MPALLTAFTRNWYVCPSARPRTGYRQVFTGLSLHGTQSSDPATHLERNTARGVPSGFVHNIMMSFLALRWPTYRPFNKISKDWASSIITGGYPRKNQAIFIYVMAFHIEWGSGCTSCFCCSIYRNSKLQWLRFFLLCTKTCTQ